MTIIYLINRPWYVFASAQLGRRRNLPQSLLADRFREKYPKQSIAVLASAGTVISAVTKDVASRGIKAGDLITAIGGRGGGRPDMAQGSLPDGAKATEALGKVAKAVEEKLK